MRAGNLILLAALLAAVVASFLYLGIDLGALVTANVDACGVQDTVLGHDARQRLEQRAAVIHTQTEVEAPRAAVRRRLGIDLRVVRPRRGFHRHELPTPVLGETPHLLLREDDLGEFRVIPVCVALVVQLVRQNRVRLGQLEEALHNFVPLQVGIPAQTRSTPPLALHHRCTRVYRCDAFPRQRRARAQRGLRTPSDRAEHG
mgnify:CR=1 FL=1